MPSRNGFGSQEIVFFFIINSSAATRMIEWYNSVRNSLHYPSCYCFLLMITPVSCSFFYCLFSGLYTFLLCTRWWFKGNFPLLPTLTDTCNFWMMKYSWKGGYLILQEDWINNTCGEGTAGRGGAVFNCPSAWRISQRLTASGRKQTDTQTYFHQCCFCILFPSIASVLCMYGLFAPLSSEMHMLIHYSLSVWLTCCFLGKF